MIKVNLLPFRAARRKENIRRQTAMVVISIGVVVAGLLFYHMHLNGKLEDAEARIKKTNQEIGRFRKINAEISRIKGQLNVLNKMNEVIETLEAQRRQPVQLLDGMTRMVVPKRMWFTFLNASGSTVDIQGNALDNKTVADFMTRLERSGLFSSVNLRTLNQQRVEEYNLSLKHFEINCSRAVAPAKAQ